MGKFGVGARRFAKSALQLCTLHEESKESGPEYGTGCALKKIADFTAMAGELTGGFSNTVTKRADSLFSSKNQA